MFAELVKNNKTDLENIALGVRMLSMDAVLAAKSGHVGLPLGGAEIGTLLYFAAMKYSTENPRWIDRDRFVLSAGHGSMLQYSLLHLAGFNLPLEEIKNFRQWGSKTPGHPEFKHTEGVECTTGPLGQGIANAVGMALAERMLAARVNTSDTNVVDHRTYVLMGDGCTMEGVASEACSLAGHLKLNKLIAFYDDNNVTIDGECGISFSENVAKRFEAYGWNVFTADGNDFDSLARALDQATAKSKDKEGSTGPSLIVCKTVIGKGSPKWERKNKVHGNPMSADDVVDAKKNLGVDNTTPFFVPEKCLASARKLGEARAKTYQTWTENFEKTRKSWASSAPEKLKLWDTLLSGELKAEISPDGWKQAAGKTSTRVAGGKALVELAKQNPALVGGSADLAGSNCTNLPDTTFVSAGNYAGRNIHFGVREHGMAAIANGISLHGAFRPYCATFAVFSDYMRPSIRLAALMGTPVTFILTHDSYGVGEDGPTHQPVEHAAALRAIPNLMVIRPADGTETFAAWEYAASLKDRPTAFLLTRQDLPDLDSEVSPIRNKASVMDGIKNGAYILKDFSSAEATQHLTLIASGSEVFVAARAAKLLESKVFHTLSGEKVKLNVRVVSAPAPQLLTENPVTLNRLVPSDVPTVAIEAGSPQGWGEVVGRNGAIFGMKHFGASAPADVLSKKFGFVPETLLEFVSNYLKLRNS